jgi:sulfur transfer complex TusBCD TusB component (DsrH family)
MKQSKLYEAQFGDTIDKCIDSLMKIAKDESDDVFLRFNGVYLRITPEHTKQQLIEDYNIGLHEASLASMEQCGDILKVKDIADVIARGIKKLVKEEEWV